MVHISLPHRISHLHNSKQNGAPSTLEPRPSPSRNVSTAGSMILTDQKPLILKIYVIRVGIQVWIHISKETLIAPAGPKPRRKGPVRNKRSSMSTGCAAETRTDSYQYLVVNLGTSKQSTPSISKNLNPEWKICLDMPLTGVPLVECVCWDKDRFGKDYMGEFDIAVEDIFANGKVQQEVIPFAMGRR